MEIFDCAFSVPLLLLGWIGPDWSLIVGSGGRGGERRSRRSVEASQFDVLPIAMNTRPE